MFRRKPDTIEPLSNREVDREAFAEAMGRLSGLHLMANRARDAASALLERTDDRPATLKRTDPSYAGYRKLRGTKGAD